MCYDDGVPVSDNSVMYEISRRGPLFYSYFEAASLCKLRCFFFFLNFMILEYKIVPRQCEIYGISKFFFLKKVLYCTRNLFCPFDHLASVCPELFHISFVYITWL